MHRRKRGPPSAIAGIEASLEDAAGRSFGGAVIIEQEGKTLLSKGYGLADRARSVPFSVDTIAQVGSITKTFTGSAVAQLVADGRVDLSAPVGRYVEDAPEPARSCRIGQLLTHRSGLADACGNDFDPVSEERLLTHCLAMPLAHAAGEDHYSNLGYAVLALVIERVTGQSWSEYLSRTVWTPLGLKDVGFYFPTPADRRFAVGYLRDQPQGVISDRIAALRGEDWNLRGNGGVQASARTMMRFLNVLLDTGASALARARPLILAPVSEQKDGVAEGFGLFFRFDEKGLVRVGHSGSDGVFYSYLCWLPRQGIRLYFVGNNGEDQILPLVRATLAALRDLPARDVAY